MTKIANTFNSPLNSFTIYKIFMLNFVEITYYMKSRFLKNISQCRKIFLMYPLLSTFLADCLKFIYNKGRSIKTVSKMKNKSVNGVRYGTALVPIRTPRFKQHLALLMLYRVTLVYWPCFCWRCVDATDRHVKSLECDALLLGGR